MFHNIRSYDGHLIIQELGKFWKKIGVLPNNMKRYMSFIVDDDIVFIDGLQFMASSLDWLASNLPDNDYKYTSEVYTGRNLERMKRKDVYPYDYMDSLEKFDDGKRPEKSLFYSIMNGCSITDSDYNHAKKVGKEFDMESLGDYDDVYLKTDLLILADVFENIRKTYLEYYQLDPCH